MKIIATVKLPIQAFWVRALRKQVDLAQQKLSMGGIDPVIIASTFTVAQRMAAIDMDEPFELVARELRSLTNIAIDVEATGHIGTDQFGSIIYEVTITTTDIDGPKAIGILNTRSIETRIAS